MKEQAVRRMGKNDSVCPLAYLLILAAMLAHGALGAAETSATAFGPVTLHAVTPIGDVSVILPSGTDFQIVGRDKDMVTVAEGPFVGKVSLQGTSLWHKTPVKSQVGEQATAKTDDPKKESKGWICDRALPVLGLIAHYFKQEPLGGALCLFIGVVILSMILARSIPRTRTVGTGKISAPGDDSSFPLMPGEKDQQAKELESAPEEERSKGKESPESCETKIAALKEEIAVAEDARKELEAINARLLEKLNSLESLSSSLKEQCLAYEAKLTKSASAPCPHCEQAVQLVFLNKGSNKCPNCNGEIFCE